MEKRKLGNTGLNVSVLGFGGFHLVEITSAEASTLLNSYLDAGGSYIETAASYGNGISESKIGAAVSGRRGEYLLATKSTVRTRDGCMAELEASLRNLKTDHVDVFYIHEPQTVAVVDQVLGPGGAMEAAEKARRDGKVRFIGVTGHGRPDALIDAVSRHPFDVLMTGFNYFDRFNYPAVEGELLPLCLGKGVGVFAMKSLADGYLHRSLLQALRYTLSLPVAAVVMGINSREMLEKDLSVIHGFKPMTEREKEKLYRSAPELGDYVCRLCGKCVQNGFDPTRVFLLEGVFDRQMDDMRVGDSAQYALRERLRFWFGQQELARSEYGALEPKVDPAADYSHLSALCPFGIDVERKLKIAHGKLAQPRYIA
jgi:aryl-alcohol dehydrogenase-like predicted oxidoreductase